MTKEELLDSLGTIARSGTAKFAERVKETKGDAQLIGQFGVGFYSSFLVAEKVTVQTKSNSSDKQWLWESASGSHSFKVIVLFCCLLRQQTSKLCALQQEGGFGFFMRFVFRRAEVLYRICCASALRMIFFASTQMVICLQMQSYRNPELAVQDSTNCRRVLQPGFADGWHHRIRLCIVCIKS